MNSEDAVRELAEALLASPAVRVGGRAGPPLLTQASLSQSH